MYFRSVGFKLNFFQTQPITQLQRSSSKPSVLLVCRLYLEMKLDMTYLPGGRYSLCSPISTTPRYSISRLELLLVIRTLHRHLAPRQENLIPPTTHFPIWTSHQCRSTTWPYLPPQPKLFLQETSTNLPGFRRHPPIQISLTLICPPQSYLQSTS